MAKQIPLTKLAEFLHVRKLNDGCIEIHGHTWETCGLGRRSFVSLDPDDQRALFAFLKDHCPEKMYEVLR